MSKEVIEQFKEWFSRALDEFSRRVEELDVRLKTGELTENDIWEIYDFVIAETWKIIRMRPSFFDVVRRATPLLQFLGEYLRVPSGEAEEK